MTFNVPVPQLPTLSRRVRVLLVAVVVVIVALILLNVFVSQYTSLLWFRSVGHASVYSRRLVTELLLFAMFGLAMAIVVAVNIVLAYRFRPAFRPASQEQQQLDAARDVLHRFRWWVLAIVSVFIGIITGASASTHWKTWLLWRNGTSFGIKDPQFHRDISYFAFTYPMQRYVLSVLFAIVIVSLIAVLITEYVFGGVRLQTPGPKWTPAGRVHVSVLLGVFVLLKAVAYWLDRYGLAFSGRGIVTGPSYTDVNAVLPAKTILVFVAVICALLFFANIVTRNWLLPAVALGLMVLSAIVIGGVYPALVQQFKVKPSASDLEAPYIQRNITATRAAYGIGSVKPQSYAGVFDPTSSPTTLRADANAVAQIRVLDPNVVSQTFEQLQQQRSYYTFPETLDVDRYPGLTTDGSQSLTDTVVGVRDVNLSGLQPGQRNWINEHLVYTHGYGMVAAVADTSTSGGAPDFVEQDLPPTGSIPITQNGARIYFGESSPSYSIVGAPAGAKPRELDLPSGNANGQTNTTYDGNGGVKIGSTWRQLLYAWKFKDKNILLASGVNSKSQILYVRDPRKRVAKVAPWLTLDGDPYPVVVGGQIEWVVDGYTTTSGYPYSEQQSLGSATKTSLTTTSTSVSAQQNTKINYIRNSVKATVNAYTGKVTLYAWNQKSDPDPVLETWEKAFPGVVQPETSMPAALVPHLRYPEDLFNVQRELLTQYHVLQPHAFYNGTEFWNVPNDPNATDAVPQPAYYFTMTPDGSPTNAAPPVFSLTSPLVSLNRRNLTAYLSVDSQPGPNYGKFTLLTVPADRVTDGPQQVHNDIESTTTVSRLLSLLRQGGSRVVIGNLLTVPVDGGFVYVEPAYVKAAGAGSFPVLREVIADSNGTVAFAPTLDQALNGVFGVKSSPASTGSPPSSGPPSSGTGNGGGTTKVSPALKQAIAAAQQAETAAKAALRRGDFAAYGEDEQKLATALSRVAALAGSSSKSG
ncbi:MAG TPA: UPF0182 family protein [Mycobacteriales bacterium]|nr:UPF0182 family protein [Mycobacteriales bacterium]